jgi:carboxypeptidase Taq
MQSNTIKSYQVLVSKLREITALEGISGLLGWDEMVMMPEGSSNSRSAQKEALAGVIHDKKICPELGKLLSDMKNDNSGSLSDVSKANIRESHKNYIRETSLPKELVQQMAQLETSGYNNWINSRKSSDFSIFQSSLQEWVDCNIAKAKYIDPVGSPYDTLLDAYEKGMTSKRIDEIFTEVRNGLIPLINDMKTKGTKPDGTWLTGENAYDVDKQAKLCKEIALDIGFDITKGRLDVSVHPFTGKYKITAHVNKSNLLYTKKSSVCFWKILLSP